LVQAQDYRLSAPGVMVHLSPPLDPLILKGIKVHPDNPFRFDFILDKGDSQFSKDALKDESSKLIKYFLASLTIPEKDLWVNLSPYEKDRIIPQSFGLTEMGRDLLAEDYMLKQITASLIYPEDEIGKKFWKRIYEEAAKKFGTTDIPVSTFNKVWILPEKAVVYENAKAGTAYVVESKLKVMLEQDYLSLQKHAIALHSTSLNEISSIGANILREIVIPELTKEVNEDKNFARLRQIYNSLILATWYKKKIKDSILGQVYSDKNKVAGVNIDDPQEKQKIYERYLQAFKKGAYNYIKEEKILYSLDSNGGDQTIVRKYFSGGIQYNLGRVMRVTNDSAMLTLGKLGLMVVTAGLLQANPVSISADHRPLFHPASQQVQSQANALVYPDGSVMLGEKEPGIAYNPVRTYRELLDKEDGGAGDAKIIAENFKVIRVYAGSLQEMEELSPITRKIYDEYGLKTKVIFSPFYLNVIDKTDDTKLNHAIDRFIETLGQYPWIIIQLGNEDHYYVQGGIFTSERDHIPLTLEEYYAYYDKVAGLIKEKLQGRTGKPIILGQGIHLGDQGWQAGLEQTIGQIKRMRHIDAISINAYLGNPKMYEMLLRYLHQSLPNLPVVVGEFGWSQYLTTAEVQDKFNRETWSVIRQAIRKGEAAGGFLFAYNNKETAVGNSVAFEPYDKRFGVSDSLRKNTGIPYYDVKTNPIVVAPSDNPADFWAAANNPKFNKEFFQVFISKRRDSALEEANKKRMALEKAAQTNVLLTDGEIQKWGNLNFVGAAYLYLGVTALYENDLKSLEFYYTELLKHFSQAQMYFGPQTFWSPFQELQKQIELARALSEPGERLVFDRILGLVRAVEPGTALGQGTIDRAMTNVLSRRAMLMISAGGLTALLTAKATLGQRTQPSVFNSNEANSWLRQQITPGGLVNSFTGLPNGDSSVGVTWMYNQGQAIQEFLALNDIKRAELLARAALRVKGKYKSWFNAYNTANGQGATKLSEQSISFVGPNAVMGHAMLNLLEVTDDPQLAEDLLKASIGLGEWLNGLLKEKDGYRFVVTQEVSVKATTEHNIRAAAFYLQFFNQLNNTAHKYRSLFTQYRQQIDRLGLKVHGDEIIEWIQNKMWDPAQKRYNVGYEDFTSGKLVTSDSDQWAYSQYILPLMANIAGLKPSDFAGGMDWLMGHLSTLRVDGRTYTGVSRWLNSPSLWGKGTAETIIALELLGRGDQTGELKRTLAFLQNPDGGVKEAYGEGTQWPVHFPYSSIEAVMPALMVAEKQDARFLAQNTGSASHTDSAMLKGGIDLTPANMKLQTQNNGGEIKFHLDPAMLKQLQNAPGFVPIIISIQPMVNLRQFLGVA